MDKKTKQNLFFITFGVALFAMLMNLDHIATFLSHTLDIAFPVVLGFIIAFILNVPMRGFEKLICKLTSKSKRKIKDGAVRGISLFLTVLSLLLVIFIISALLLPKIVDSVMGLVELVVEKWPEWIEKLASYNINTERIAAWFETLDFEKITENLTNGAGTILSSAMSVVTTTVSGISRFIIAVIIAIYVLISKKDLEKHTKRLINVHVKEPIGDYVLRIASMINDTYSKFLSGQCVEAVILGVLIFITYRIFNIPYAELIGLLTTVLAFIPYIGGFSACFIGAFLVLLTSPEKVIIAIIVYVVVQFIETQFIYPHVVGGSVGLSPLWTLVAVFLGGSLMGFIGMIFFIPLTAVVFTLIKGYTQHVVKKKHCRNVE